MPGAISDLPEINRKKSELAKPAHPDLSNLEDILIWTSKYKDIVLDRLQDYLQSSQLLEASNSLLLAVSGGPDSMAMLHLFCRMRERWNLRLEVVHLNHGIRGKEGDEDAGFVNEACKHLGIPFRLFQFNVPKYAKEKKLSIEEAGRQIRFHFFCRYAKAKKFDRMAFAHTADDQAETILLNLFRGAGPRGLSGIPVRNGLVIHPMLKFRKKELLQFLEDHELQYRVDKSNETRDYARNRVRLEVLPFLEERLQRNIRENLIRTAEIVSEEEAWFEKQITVLFQKRFRLCGKGISRLELPSEDELPPPLERRLVRKFLESSLGTLDGVTFHHIEEVRKLLQKENGK